MCLSRPRGFVPIDGAHFPSPCLTRGSRAASFEDRDALASGYLERALAEGARACLARTTQCARCTIATILLCAPAARLSGMQRRSNHNCYRCFALDAAASARRSACACAPRRTRMAMLAAEKAARGCPRVRVGTTALLVGLAIAFRTPQLTPPQLLSCAHCGPSE